jgi:hypothetical protein
MATVGERLAGAQAAGDLAPWPESAPA